jgi:hypothetical protein
MLRDTSNLTIFISDNLPLLQVQVRRHQDGYFQSQADDPELDIEIYTLGDKYDYLALQVDAINNFKEWVERAWSSSEFRALTQKIWDHPCLLEMHRLAETIIADLVLDLCSPTADAEDSIVKQGLKRGVITEEFILRIANRRNG